MTSSVDVERAAAEQFGRYLSSLAHLSSNKAIRTHLYESTHKAFEDDTAKVFAKLRSRVQSGEPCSLIRLGDGEGNLLFWGRYRESMPELAKQGLRRMWWFMQGRTPLPDVETTQYLFDRLVEASEDADFLGVYQPGQILDAVTTEKHKVAARSGIIEVHNWATKASLSPEQTLMWCFFHSKAIDLFGRLVEDAGNLSIISCYPELLKRAHFEFGVSRGVAHIIPPQAVNIDATPEASHYPERFEEISNRFEGADLCGQLFFVGAGVPGKHYCKAIKDAGGIAIDVGSAMDVWMGIGVRPYHHENSYTDRHALK